MVMLLVSGFQVLFVTGRCPTYQTNLIVEMVDSYPHVATVGTTVRTTVHVTYPDGTPAFLSPETVSFVWSSSKGEKVVENAAVVPTGEPGFYICPEMVTESLPTGTVTIRVLYCSCTDALGNRGPTDNISSDTTATMADDSHVDIGPASPKPTATQPKPTAIQQPLSLYAVPIVIAVLLIIAALLFIARARATAKKVP